MEKWLKDKLDNNFEEAVMRLPLSYLEDKALHNRYIKAFKEIEKKKFGFEHDWNPNKIVSFGYSDFAFLSHLPLESEDYYMLRFHFGEKQILYRLYVPIPFDETTFNFENIIQKHNVNEDDSGWYIAETNPANLMKIYKEIKNEIETIENETKFPQGIGGT